MYQKGWGLNRKIMYILYSCACANKAKKTKMQVFFIHPHTFFNFYFIHLYIFPPDLQENIRDTIPWASLKQLLKLAFGDAKILLSN